MKFPMVGILVLTVATALAQTEKSSGTNDANSLDATVKRDPFWPVGFVPEKIAKAAKKSAMKKSTVSKDWAGAMKKVVINGVSSKGKDDFYAVVNGELKSVGDTFSVDHNGTTYTWAVASIQPPGSVRLRRVSAL